mmetsp:Transcript_110435/g.276452  ORF Transcript_110435/g.276452 Transcript_110435/m.276452 type:complete len:227 (-) Transcript_110435:187-867(-)
MALRQRSDASAPGIAHQCDLEEEQEGRLHVAEGLLTPWVRVNQLLIQVVDQLHGEYREQQQQHHDGQPTPKHGLHGRGEAAHYPLQCRAEPEEFDHACEAENTENLEPGHRRHVAAAHDVSEARHDDEEIEDIPIRAEEAEPADEESKSRLQRVQAQEDPARQFREERCAILWRANSVHVGVVYHQDHVQPDEDADPDIEAPMLHGAGNRQPLPTPRISVERGFLP